MQRISIGWAIPVPQRTLSPDTQNADQHNFSVGFGCTSKGLVVDAFSMADFFSDKRVANSIFSGKYQSLGHFICRSIEYGF